MIEGPVAIKIIAQQLPTPIDPLLFQKGLREFHIIARDEIIDSEEVAFIPSGAEWAVKSLVIDGVLHNDGFITIQKELIVNGILFNDGTIEVGW